MTKKTASKTLSLRTRPLGALLACSLALAGCVADSAAESTASATDAAEAAQIFAGIPQQGNVLGDPSAPVTLTEFSDLRCSHCRDFAQKTLPVLVDRYVRTGRLRIVFGNLPILGEPSSRAARMAAAVGLQGHLFEFVEVFFRESPRTVSDDVLGRLAASVPGVNVELALLMLNTPAVDAALAESRNLANRFSITGTPSILLGKTGTEPHLVRSARATQPETLTGPIEELLAQH